MLQEAIMVVEAKALSRKYGNLTAVDGVSFGIREGELFSLLGPNGAGKSTTIGMLCGLVEPCSGDATICGLSVRDNSREVRALCGVVPQDIALYEELSARDNLLFFGRLYGLRGRELRGRVEEVLERVGLTDRERSRVKTLSGGMKRRLNIAAGILHRPRMIFMDEPTVGIDPRSRRAVLDLIRDLRRDGAAILYTTHSMAEAEELSDRVGIIDHGRLLASGTPRELAESLGGTERMQVAVDPGVDGRRLADALRDVPGVAVEAKGSLVTLTAARVREHLARVVEAAAALKAPVRDIEIRGADLETVFLACTGRELSAQGDEA
jgi:ABC-2 type transport system ATP-binding protein